MKEAIKILEKLLAETTISKFATVYEYNAARSALVKAIAVLNEHAALNNVKKTQQKEITREQWKEYFKHQKELL